MFAAAPFRRVLSLHHLRTMASEASQAKLIDGTALAAFVLSLIILLRYYSHLAYLSDLSARMLRRELNLSNLSFLVSNPNSPLYKSASAPILPPTCA
jgi:hypothetical protein